MLTPFLKITPFTPLPEKPHPSPIILKKNLPFPSYNIHKLSAPLGSLIHSLPFRKPVHFSPYKNHSLFTPSSKSYPYLTILKIVLLPSIESTLCSSLPASHTHPHLPQHSSSVPKRRSLQSLWVRKLLNHDRDHVPR